MAIDIYKLSLDAARSMHDRGDKQDGSLIKLVTAQINNQLQSIITDIENVIKEADLESDRYYWNNSLDSIQKIKELCNCMKGEGLK